MSMPKSKTEFIDMIRSLFKIMIHGVSHDRLRVLWEEALNSKSMLRNMKMTKAKEPLNLGERALTPERR